LVKLPGRIVVKRGACYLGKADHRNSTVAPSQFAQAFALPLPSALSLRSNSRLGFPGEPALVGATSYKLQAAPAFKSKPPHAIAKGRIEKETGQQTAPERENPSGQHAVIPADLQITGDLVSPVEGVIHGDITCRTLTVAGQPVIQGSVEAETARISGTSNGGQSPGEKGIPDESRQNGGGNLLHTQLSTTAIYADAVGAEEHQIMETKWGT